MTKSTTTQEMIPMDNTTTATAPSPRMSKADIDRVWELLLLMEPYTKD